MKRMALALLILAAASKGVDVNVWQKIAGWFRRDMPTKRYEVNAFTLIKASPKTISDEWLKIPEKDRVRGTARGFYNYVTREMWVPYGYGDAFDAEVLQHEMRHLPEIEGRWHE